MDRGQKKTYEIGEKLVRQFSWKWHIHPPQQNNFFSFWLFFKFLFVKGTRSPEYCKERLTTSGEAAGSMGSCSPSMGGSMGDSLKTHG